MLRMFLYFSPSLFLSQRNVSEEKLAHVLLVQASELHTYYSLYLRFSRFSTPPLTWRIPIHTSKFGSDVHSSKNCFLTSVYDVCSIFVFCTRFCRGIDANVVCLHICLPWQTVNSMVGTIFNLCVPAPRVMPDMLQIWCWMNECMHAWMCEWVNEEGRNDLLPLFQPFMME